MNSNRRFPVLIGLYKTDAYKILAEFRVPYRISEEDGTCFRGTGNFDAKRINLVIKNGIIENYTFY